MSITRRENGLMSDHVTNATSDRMVARLRSGNFDPAATTADAEPFDGDAGGEARESARPGLTYKIDHLCTLGLWAWHVTGPEYVSEPFFWKAASMYQLCNALNAAVEIGRMIGRGEVR